MRQPVLLKTYDAFGMIQKSAQGTETFESYTLSQLCDLVVTCTYPYEDLAEIIEDKAYEKCDNGNFETALAELGTLSLFFEQLENKNEENSRDLADVYLLMGQMYQFAGRYIESILWFSKAIIIDDQYPIPYHTMALSYMKTGDAANAIRSLEQEIILDPGNYCSYLLLADLYDQQNKPERVEDCLKRLLMRNPENIQGLHRLIRHYEKTNPIINTELLIRRLLCVNKACNRTEIVIRAYYFCREKRYHETLDMLTLWSHESPDVSIVHLVKAHIFGLLRKKENKQKHLDAFKSKNNFRQNIMESQINEFASVFGKKNADKLSRLLMCSPAHA